jgi:hypothetical protein
VSVKPFFACLTLKMKALRPFETSRPIRSCTKRNGSKDLHPQQYRCDHLDSQILLFVIPDLRLKVKVAVRGFSIPRSLGPIVFLPQQVPAFISRAHASYSCARHLPAKARTIPPTFASRSIIYKNPLGSFTCRKAGTWDILLYFLSEGRHTFAGFESANSGSSGQYANH